MISAVIFDMDGLMLDTERLAQRAWRLAGIEWHYDFEDEVYLVAVGRSVADTEVIFKQNFGPDFPFQAIYERKQQYLYQIIETEGIPTKEGLFDLLKLVDSLNLTKAVATSTARPLALKKLGQTGLLDHFKAIICGNEVAHSKPAPDIFLAAAQALHVSPQHCLVLEDSEAGIKAAQAAKMTVIMIPDMKQPALEVASLAYRVLPSLEQVGPILRQLIRG